MNSQTIRVEMIGELIDLVKNCQTFRKTDDTDDLILRVLALPDDTNDQILASISEIKAENSKIVPYVHNLPNSCYYISCLSEEKDESEDEILRTMKIQLLRGLKEIAHNLYDPKKKKHPDDEIIEFVYKGISQCSLDATASSLYTTVHEMNTYIDMSRSAKFEEIGV